MEFNIKRDTVLRWDSKDARDCGEKNDDADLEQPFDPNRANRIMIIATDREIGLVADYEAEIIREGDITLSARKLHEMVREIRGEMIHVSKDERNMVVLTCKKEMYRLPGIPADDYPVVAAQEGLPMNKIKGSMLREMIRKTAFAMSVDEMRKNLNGVFLETERSGGTY